MSEALELRSRLARLTQPHATATQRREFAATVRGYREAERAEAQRVAEREIEQYLRGRVCVYLPLGDLQLDVWAAALDRCEDLPVEASSVDDDGQRIEFETAGNRFVNEAESDHRIWRSDHALSGCPEDDAPLVCYFELNAATGRLVDPAHLASLPRIASHEAVVFDAGPALPGVELARRFSAVGLEVDDFEASMPAADWTADLCRALTEPCTAEPTAENKDEMPDTPEQDAADEEMPEAVSGSEVDPDAPTALDLFKLRTGPREPRMMLEDDVVTEKHVTKFVAGSGVGKTVLLADFAVHWSLGCSALDRGSDGQPRELDGPKRVLYVDGEVGPLWWADYLDRFDAPLALPNLFVVSMESIAPLTTDAGAQDLAGLVERYRPDIVILDTLSSFIDGAENDSDTWIAFDNRITLPLKAMGLTVIYADHSGKDPSLGARGSSAKRSKLDAEWTLTVPRVERPNELTLSRLKDRSGSLPERVNIKRLDGPLGHVRVRKDKAGRVLEAVPTPTAEELDAAADAYNTTPTIPAVNGPRDARVRALIAELDRLEIPAEWGRDRARASAASKLEGSYETSVWRAALKYRKQR